MKNKKFSDFKFQYFFYLLPLILILFLILTFSCSKPIFNNPYDPDAEPSSWAPKDLKYTKLSISEIRLDWKDNCSVEKGYKIDKKVGYGNWQIDYGSLSANITNWSDSNAEINNFLQYRVYCYIESLNSEFVETEVINNSIPSPTNLHYEKLSISTIKLDWQDNSNGEAGFKIDKKVGNSSWQIVYDTISEDIEEWFDENADINETIKYRVYAYYGNFNSEKTTTPAIDNTIPVPENLTYQILSNNKIRLQWEYNISGISGFKVLRQIEEGSWDIATTLNSNVLHWTDYSFTFESEFHYRIIAFYENYNSDYSNEVIIKVSQIYWDDGTNYSGIGLEGGGKVDFDVAIRFKPSDLTQYDGMYLFQISFYPRSSNCEYSIRVWTGGSVSGGEGNSGTRIVNQLVSNPNINHWNQVELDNPVLIDASKELWFGYRCNAQSGYPAGCDDGPSVAWKGDLIHWYGTWRRMSCDYNWNIHGFVNISSSGKGADSVIKKIK